VLSWDPWGAFGFSSFSFLFTYHHIVNLALASKRSPLRVVRVGKYPSLGGNRLHSSEPRFYPTSLLDAVATKGYCYSVWSEG